jgi:hypothetical protein
MSLGTKTNDWQVCGIGQAGAAAGVGIGAFLFAFYSEKLDLSAIFNFSGGGVGLGGNLNGTGYSVRGLISPWTSLECKEPFSVLDLNKKGGRLTNLNIGVGITFGVVMITAFKNIWKPLFFSQDVGGFATGLGASAFTFGGQWTFEKVSHIVPAKENESWA